MIPWEILTEKLDELDVVRAQVAEARAQKRTASFFEILLAKNTLLEREKVGDAVQLGNGWCLVHWKFPKRRGVAMYESIALLGIAMHADGEFLLNLVETSEERKPVNTRSSVTWAGLTPAERKVLKELSHGLSNSEIARVLGLKPNTIRNATSVIFTKLNVHDRTQAALLGRDLDLLTTEGD